MYVFLSNNETHTECIERMLVGTNNPGYYEHFFKKIKPGDWICVYNYNTYTLHGMYTACSTCAKDIEPDAWRGAQTRGYPYQVRISGDYEFKTPLTLDDLFSLGVSENRPGQRPYILPQIREEGDEKVWDCFLKKNSGQTFSEVERNLDEGSSYIFMCDRKTGGEVWAKNMVGAPSHQFKKVVRNVQEGDRIYVWQIEDRQLFGVWSAKSRGQWNPSAFANHTKEFHAVVYCDRTENWKTPLAEEEVRAIVPYDGSLPPYRISYQQGRSLFQELQKRNAAGMTTPGQHDKIMTEDNHPVRSGGEARIDDWLFRHRIAHIPENRIDFGESQGISDFYLPDHKVYIEYWGLAEKDEKYRQRMDEKKRLYKQNNLKLVEIYPRDMQVLSDVLYTKLRAAGVQIRDF